MPAFLFIIAGLVLLLAGSSWFTGAATVGAILLIVGGVGLVFALVIFALAAAAIKSKRF
jgi:hypothetical protein